MVLWFSASHQPLSKLTWTRISLSTFPSWFSCCGAVMLRITWHLPVHISITKSKHWNPSHGTLSALISPYPIAPVAFRNASVPWIFPNERLKDFPQYSVSKVWKGIFCWHLPHGLHGSSPFFLVTVLSMLSIFLHVFQYLAVSTASYRLNIPFLLPHYFIMSSALSLLLKLEWVSLFHFFSAQQSYSLPSFFSIVAMFPINH